MDKANLTIPISGMTCASCVSRVEKSFEKINGAQSVNVNLATGQASISYDSKTATVADFIRTVKSIGYDVPLLTTDLRIAGMSCASCVSAIEKDLLAKEGVIEAAVNLSTETASIKHIAGLGFDDFKKIIENAGYKAISISAESGDDYQKIMEDENYKDLKIKVITSGIITLVILVFAMTPLMPLTGSPRTIAAITTTMTPGG